MLRRFSVLHSLATA